MQSFCDAFRRNEDGSWVCVEAATIQGPDVRIEAAAGRGLYARHRAGRVPRDRGHRAHANRRDDHAAPLEIFAAPRRRIIRRPARPSIAAVGLAPRDFLFRAPTMIPNYAARIVHESGTTTRNTSRRHTVAIVAKGAHAVQCHRGAIRCGSYSAHCSLPASRVAAVAVAMAHRPPAPRLRPL